MCSVVIKGHVPQQFSRGDWRFLELPTPALHMLYSASVELLSLPDFPGAAVGRSLLELVSSRYVVTVPSEYVSVCVCLLSVCLCVGLWFICVCVPVYV